MRDIQPIHPPRSSAALKSTSAIHTKRSARHLLYNQFQSHLQHLHQRLSVSVFAISVLALLLVQLPKANILNRPERSRGISTSFRNASPYVPSLGSSGTPDPTYVVHFVALALSIDQLFQRHVCRIPECGKVCNCVGWIWYHFQHVSQHRQGRFAILIGHRIPGITVLQSSIS